MECAVKIDINWRQSGVGVISVMNVYLRFNLFSRNKHQKNIFNH